MTTKLPRKDVVVIGLGWTGAIIANEMADEGLEVVAIERGPWRDTARDFNIASAADELRYNQRQELMLQTAQNTITVRNNISDGGGTGTGLLLFADERRAGSLQSPSTLIDGTVVNNLFIAGKSLKRNFPSLRF